MTARRGVNTEPPPKKIDRDVASRWTPTLVEDGFTPISNYFLENYARLDEPLSAVEAMFVVHLMKFKWDRAHPFPKFALLASQMKMKESGVRACARKLQSKGCLVRRLRGRSNEFDLTPLFTKLEAFREKNPATAALAASEPAPETKTEAEAENSASA